MRKQASLVAWYGLSCSGAKTVLGLPESTHIQLAPHFSSMVFPTGRQMAAEAQRLIGSGRATLVLHGIEYGAELYGLAAASSVVTVSAVGSPLAIDTLPTKAVWNEEVLKAARILKWPASTMQWWVAPLLSEDPE